MKTMTQQSVRRRRGRAVRRIRRTTPPSFYTEVNIRFELMTISLTYVFSRFAALDALIAAGPATSRPRLLHNGRKAR